MARTVELFLDSDQPLALVARDLAGLVGARLSPLPGTSGFALSDGPVDATVREHAFVDDEGLPLSAFRYVVTVVVAGTYEPEAGPELHWLRALRRRVRDERPWACLLVVDLERPDAGDAEGAGERGR